MGFLAISWIVFLWRLEGALWHWLYYIITKFIVQENFYGLWYEGTWTKAYGAEGAPTWWHDRISKAMASRQWHERISKAWHEGIETKAYGAEGAPMAVKKSNGPTWMIPPTAVMATGRTTPPTQTKHHADDEITNARRKRMTSCCSPTSCLVK